MSTSAYLDALGVPVIEVTGQPWTVIYANKAAHEWLGARVGVPLLSLMPELDQEKISARLQRGRAFRLSQATRQEPALPASYQFVAMPDGDSVLIEGRDDSAAAEAQSMINAYSKMVETQKRKTEEEKTKVEKLLLNMLPRKTMEELQLLGSTKPESFADVSVMFLDFVGFTSISQAVPKEFLFDELNEMFTTFDKIVASHGCERIKTIGDAYLAVCGMPEPSATHAQQLVGVALQIRDYLTKRNVNHSQQWLCRIGIHSGPVVAGIVGKLKYIYDIFGDGVNTAARMEAHASPMHINISKSTYDHLDGMFVCEPRGAVAVKGKGEMEMFYVQKRSEQAPHDHQWGWVIPDSKKGPADSR